MEISRAAKRSVAQPGRGVAVVASVTLFEDGHRAVGFDCPRCAVLHEGYVCPDSGLQGANILGPGDCVCGWRGSIVAPGWALPYLDRGGYRRYLESNRVLPATAS